MASQHLNGPTDAGHGTVPPGFLWGAATASYQIEGAVDEGGRLPSIWDTFSRTPGAVLAGDTGDVAADHYHRMPQDVDLMERLGLQAYRFSVAWPRIQPSGRGPVNRAGVHFYDALVDRLLGAGIEPVVTLYHWDLPQALQDEGGWAARDTAFRFADYAALVAEALGDRVHTWTTLNEPWCSAYLGHASGEHAPGIVDHAAALSAVHHLNLAHGLGARAVRSVLGDATPVSLTLNLQVVSAATADEADVAAARRVDVMSNEVFLGPVLDGAYPAEAIEATQHLTDWSFVADGDLDVIGARLDSLGLNYYNTQVVRARRPDEPISTAVTAHVAADDVVWLPVQGQTTEMGWNVDPAGLTEVLVGLSRRFPELPLMVTENGAAFVDPPVTDGTVHDGERLDFVRDHVAAVLAARERGADVRAYFLWSLMDNFEWAYGYARRFGIVHVDYETQERVVKDSGRWYRDMIASTSTDSARGALSDGGATTTRVQENMVMSADVRGHGPIASGELTGERS